MDSFFKKASIVLLVVVLVPVITFLAYLAWLDRQESEVAVMSLKCQSEVIGTSTYYRISKKRKSDTPDYLSVLNPKENIISPNSDLFFTPYELKRVTGSEVEYHLTDDFILENTEGRLRPAKIGVFIDRETLTMKSKVIETTMKSKVIETENAFSSIRQCEEISERDIMKVARKNLAAATKDRKF